jgi:hypothetical protein
VCFDGSIVADYGAVRFDTQFATSAKDAAVSRSDMPTAARALRRWAAIAKLRPGARQPHAEAVSVHRAA